VLIPYRSLPATRPENFWPPGGTRLPPVFLFRFWNSLKLVWHDTKFLRKFTSKWERTNERSGSDKDRLWSWSFIGPVEGFSHFLTNLLRNLASCQTSFTLLYSKHLVPIVESQIKCESKLFPTDDCINCFYDNKSSFKVNPEAVAACKFVGFCFSPLNNFTLLGAGDIEQLFPYIYSTNRLLAGTFILKLCSIMFIKIRRTF
jgi:hypothetical protein